MGQLTSCRSEVENHPARRGMPPLPPESNGVAVWTLCVLLFAPGSGNMCDGDWDDMMSQ